MHQYARPGSGLCTVECYMLAATYTASTGLWRKVSYAELYILVLSVCVCVCPLLLNMELKQPSLLYSCGIHHHYHHTQITPQVSCLSLTWPSAFGSLTAPYLLNEVFLYLAVDAFT